MDKIKINDDNNNNNDKANIDFISYTEKLIGRMYVDVIMQLKNMVNTKEKESLLKCLNLIADLKIKLAQLKTYSSIEMERISIDGNR